jgi:hypothetical protein
VNEQKSLAEITAELKAIMGVTDDSPGARAWRNIRNSQRDCSCCGKCGKSLASDERVCRTRISRYGGFGGWQHSLVALCQECTEQDWHWKYRRMVCKPCEGCGRKVWSEARLRWSDETNGYLTIPVTCCEQCAEKVRLATARGRRRDRRGTHDCQLCGETFEPTRTDAKFCSVACKQKAYRRRVTDDERPPRRPRNNRNDFEPKAKD